MHHMKFKNVVLSYDCEADAVYIKVREGKVHKTIEQTETVYVDLDSHGRLIGIEILDPKHTDTETIKRISSKYHIPEVKPINPRAIPSVYACV